MGIDRHPGDANGTLAADATKRGIEPAGDAITVRVTAFGSLRSVIGGPSTQVSVPRGTTAAVLAERLADQFPGLAPMAMLAVDGGNEMLPLNSLLSDGPSVERIPPMAGG